MRVLIAGAAGLVGTELARFYNGDDVAALRRRELDITDENAVEATVQRLQPDVVFNCAVIGVDDCEADPGRAHAVNVSGPAHLAAAAQRIGASFVHFSSNYVFDGRRTSGVPYTIDDEALPVNVYGATKLQGERAVAGASTRALIVRTSWVFGAGKNSFLSTVAERLSLGERVQAISDTFASTTYVVDLVARVAALVERGEAGTVQVVNEGVCSYESFAREAARLVGASEELIETVTEESMGRPATRPRWTPMECVPPMRSWEEALAEYVHDHRQRAAPREGSRE
ncbi:MAG: NAD(P)-dependent oxidoreductase [Acidobacteriota bacterium]